MESRIFLVYVRRLGRTICRVYARLLPRHFPIAYKLGLVFTLLITVGMTGLSYLIAKQQDVLLQQLATEYGTTVVQQMAETAEELLLANDRLGLEVIVNNLLSHERILGAGIYSDERLPVVGAGLLPGKTLLNAGIDSGASVEWRGPGEKESATLMLSYVAAVIFQDLNVGYAVATFDRSFLVAAQRQTFQTVIVITLAMILFGMLISFYLGKWVSKPINQLMDASQAIRSGDYSFRFKERRNDELGSLMDSINHMTAGLIRKQQVEKAFSRYVSPKIAKAVLNDLDNVELGGHHVKASVLFADIVGFTAMSEKMQPKEINALLNEYFSVVADAAQVCNGHVDKFIGDCAMLVFGVPVLKDENHCFNAVSCAVLIKRLVSAINVRRVMDGKHSVEFRIGVNAGEMLAGNMGSKDRMEYTVVGDAVNLASRLSGLAAAGEIIIGEHLNNAEQINGLVETELREKIKVRGKKKPIAIYNVVGVCDHHQKHLDEQVAHILQRNTDGENDD